MTTHYAKEFRVETYPFLKSYISKDNKQQVNIRVRIIPRNEKMKEPSPIDFHILDEQDQPIKLTKTEFRSNRYSLFKKRRMEEIDERIKYAVNHFLSNNLELSKQKLKRFIYNDMEQVANKKLSVEYESDPDLLELFGRDKDDPVPLEVANRVYSMTEEDFTDPDTGEQNDIGAIVDNLESEFYREQERKEIENMGWEERYEKGLFDSKNIFELFGFCWTTDARKGKPFVSKAYKSLIIKLADYRYNQTPPEQVGYFSLQWVEDFILFLKNEGYPLNFHPNKYTPFNLDKYASDLITKDREPYTYSSFNKQIKHLKFYIEVLQKEGLLPRRLVDTRDIKTSTYLSEDAPLYTRSNHYLINDELQLLLHSQFNNDRLETARVMFLIQTLAGGLRNDELFNEHFQLKKMGNEYYFSFFANKNKKGGETPVIPSYTDVLLEQINYTLPKFLDVDDYRKTLKEIALELGFNREIQDKRTKVNKKIQPLKRSISEIFAPYFARKTFPRLARSLGLSNEEICSFTLHQDVRTLKHYIDDHHYEDKKNILKRKIQD